MDPLLPRLEEDTRRRRRRSLFKNRKVPVRMLVPNFFTLLALCAGLTSIRMSIEQRWELAIILVVFAALLDGVDGRVARLLKASSRFGAELDSLADFVNFGVAPAVLVFTWGLGSLKSLGWIAVLIFALASALRLARFNAALDEERPRWQANYFLGVPTPAAAIIVMLPVYLGEVGLDARTDPMLLGIVVVYTLIIATLMVATLPTFSGKLLGERIGSEWVLPVFVVAMAMVAMLATYPHSTLIGVSLAYLISIPIAVRRFKVRERAAHAESAQSEDAPKNANNTDDEKSNSDSDTGGRVVGLRQRDDVN